MFDFVPKSFIITGFTYKQAINILLGILDVPVSMNFSISSATFAIYGANLYAYVSRNSLNWYVSTSDGFGGEVDSNGYTEDDLNNSRLIDLQMNSSLRDNGYNYIVFG